jgi:hypothetical protein
MPVYALEPESGLYADTIWVRAPSAAEARIFVAERGNVTDALDPDIYKCFEDERLSPPGGVIIRGDGTTLSKV